MTDINLQFHALPCELYALSRRAKENFELVLVGATFPPRGAHIITDGELTNLEEGSAPVCDVVFVPANSSLLRGDVVPLEFPECLTLRVGKLKQGTLEISLLLYRGKNEADLAIWRRIAASIKKLGRTGGVFMVVKAGPAAGRLFPIKDHRISDRARAFAIQPNHTLLGIGGGALHIE